MSFRSAALVESVAEALNVAINDPRGHYSSTLCQHNSLCKRPRGAQETQRAATVFDSSAIPPIGIHKYLARLQATFHCSDSAFVAALAIVDRLLEYDTGRLPLTGRNVHRIFLASLVVTVKYQEDLVHSNSHYAKAGGVLLKEVNRLERVLLGTLDFDLRVTADQYRLYEAALRMLRDCPQPCLPAPATPAPAARGEGCPRSGIAGKMSADPELASDEVPADSVDDPDDEAALEVATVTSNNSLQHVDLSLAQVLWPEARRCLLMLVAFFLGVAHLHVYPACLNVKTSTDIPADERQFFHHGWTAMLVIAFIEAVTVGLKLLSTAGSAKLLRVAVLQKLEGNVGVLFGEYLVVAATYMLMGADWEWLRIPVFEEARTGRRVYGVRYMEWTVDACGLVYLDCRILFGLPFAKFWTVLIYTVIYMVLGLWSAVSSTWVLYSVFLAGSWFFFLLVCYHLCRFLKKNPEPLQQFGRAPIKHGILAFIIIWWVLYGVLFMLCFQCSDSVPQWLEQALWTGMDVVMKLSHTVVLMAWRETQWEIDAVVNRQNAEAKKTIAQLDHQRVLHERDLARLRSKVYGSKGKGTSNRAIAASDAVAGAQEGDGGQQEGDRSKELVIRDCVDDPPAPVAAAAFLSTAATALSPLATAHDQLLQARGAAAESAAIAPAAPSSGNSMTKSVGGKSPFAVVNMIFQREAMLCCVLCAAFVAALLHLPIYSDVFGVEVVDGDVIPELERGFFHHGWTCMVVVFLVEVITVALKVWSTWHDPALALVVAEQLSGNLGMLVAEYLVVGATYVIMGFNLMPAFVEQRTGRRVYGVRYMEWLIDACGLVFLDCYCLFNRRAFAEFRMAIFWTVAYIMFGFWAAIASTWAWYWVCLLCSWATFLIVCAMLVNFLREDPYPHEPFGKTMVKPCILTFIIGWWILYGVVFMVCFGYPDFVPQWLEQLLWTGMDVVMKLSHTGVLMAWRVTERTVGEIHGKTQAERKKKTLLRETKSARTEKSELEAIMLSQSASPTSGIPKGIDAASSSDSDEDHDTAHRERTDTPAKPKHSVNYWTATPGLNLGLASILHLESFLGQGVVTDRHRDAMMRAEDLAELRRLEEAGLLNARLQHKWEAHKREQTFLAAGINHIAYDPRRWSQTLLAIRGRAPTSFALWIVLVEAVIILLLSKFNDGGLLDPMVGLSSSIHALFSVPVAFLVVFRTQTAFKKWWDGRVAVSSLVTSSRTFAQQVCTYVQDDALCDRLVRYTCAAMVATRCHLRNTSIDPAMLLGVLSDAEIEELSRERNMPFFVTWAIRDSLAAAMSSGKCLPVHVSIDNSVKALEGAVASAEKLLTPMPFTYVVHVRTFLFIYLLLLPFILVEDLGWFMLVAVVFVGYAMIGLENTAVQLENPFGTDCNHHPLDLYCLEVVRDLLHLLDLRAGAKAGHYLKPNAERGEAELDRSRLKKRRDSHDDDDGGDDGD